jgi:hypothetical protein
MLSRPQILLVGNAGQARSLCEPVAAAGYETLFVQDFVRAKAHLDGGPALLVTELKLGAYNGLHLAIRASAKRIPTIIIGDHDPVLEADAARQQAVYLPAPVEPETVIAIVRKLLDRSPHARRSTRRMVPGISALVNELPVQICDVSYEGMRIETAGPHAPPAFFDLRLPQFNFSCRAQRVWTARVGEDETRLWCGAALASSDSETANAWRSLVHEMVVLDVGPATYSELTPHRRL